MLWAHTKAFAGFLNCLVVSPDIKLFILNKSDGCFPLLYKGFGKKLMEEYTARKAASDAPWFAFTVTIQNHQAYHWGKYPERPAEAAAGAAWINGRAGELAAERVGAVSMTAGNTVQKIAEAVSGFIRSYE